MNIAELEELLTDEESKRILEEVLQLREWGEASMGLPEKRLDYAANLARVEHLLRVDSIKPIEVDRFTLPYYTFKGMGGHFMGAGILNTFYLEQYACRRADIYAARGDVVIDGGACWGDTTLYFADLVGEGGEVIAYEFVPENLTVLGSNLLLNLHLAERVSVNLRALWSHSGAKISHDNRGPSTWVISNNIPEEAPQVETVSIDSLDRHIDFIKMDIEGSELAALKGARETLKNCKPQLAISVYHKPNDLTEIPAYLAELDLGYRFFLGHFALNTWETVLYAR